MFNNGSDVIASQSPHLLYQQPSPANNSVDASATITTVAHSPGAGAPAGGLSHPATTTATASTSTGTNNSSSSSSSNLRRNASVQITQQPASKALRFRYECEGRSAGSIPGVHSSPENKTFPSIQVVGYKGRAVVVVSCVTKDEPYR